MQIVIDIPEAPMEDYKDLHRKIYGMAASEGLFDDKHKSQKALALKVVLKILTGILNSTPLPKEHGRLIDVRDVEHYKFVLPPEDGDDYEHASAWNEAIDAIIENAPTIVKSDGEISNG